MHAPNNWLEWELLFVDALGHCPSWSDYLHNGTGFLNGIENKSTELFVSVLAYNQPQRQFHSTLADLKVQVSMKTQSWYPTS